MWHTMTNEEVRRKLKTDFERGLSEQEARQKAKAIW